MGFFSKILKTVFLVAAAAFSPNLRVVVVPDSYIVHSDTNLTFGSEVQVHSHFPHIHAYEIEADERTIQVLQQDRHVSAVEPNQVFKTLHETQLDVPSWGLARLSQEFLISNDYSFPSAAGQNAQVFVVDTGILARHPEFQDRATQAYVAPGMGENVDCNGHGSHVAGTVGGRETGVAKRASLVGVKVLACSGAGTTASVLNGLEFVLSQASNRTKIVNLSLGGGRSPALDSMIAEVAKNSLVVVAAGNSGGDACTGSPSGSPGAFTVAASDMRDARATFSSQGLCVNIVAPGVSITAPYIPNGFRVLSGTSMASPHVAGAAALLVAEDRSLSPDDLTKRLVASGSKGLLTGFSLQTPNLLVRVR